MSRRRAYPPLHVYQNNFLVGRLSKEVSGAITFQYDAGWLERKAAFPISLSLPFRDGPYRGAPVAAFFENLLPDSELLRRKVADRVGAASSDAYGLLAAIGADCVGALQFVQGDDEVADTQGISGEPVDDDAVERILKNLARAPLGLDRDDEFRISLAGAQEKTALLYLNGQWLRPRGATPTTHILKPQIGEVHGIDMANSVENEFYCLRLLSAFGLPVAKADMRVFGATKALVVRRFDRRWTKDDRLLRLPQEDCCQSLSVPPSHKYESDGGPGIADIIRLLGGADDPAHDRSVFFKAQILFWLIGATDGHAKNFSLHLLPGGAYRLTPLYDVLTAQPSLEARQVRRNQMKLAMSVGSTRHYRMDEIHGRHFVETGARAGLPRKLMVEAIEAIADTAHKALAVVESELPRDFPSAIHEAVAAGVRARVPSLALND
ncbi:MAG: type II toxin-antitoxin system HipA family toxin [Beijerinckiaceae bacterium]